MTSGLVRPTRRGLLARVVAIPAAVLAAKFPKSKPRGFPKTNEQFIDRIRYAMNMAVMRWGDPDPKGSNYWVYMHPATMHRYEDCGVVLTEIKKGSAAFGTDHGAARYGWPVRSNICVPPGLVVITGHEPFGMLVYDTLWRPPADSKYPTVEFI